MPRKINLIRPDGTVVSANEHDARLLLTLGYRPETPEESIDRSALKARKEYYTSMSQQALAGLEGVGSGLTLGISDLFTDDDATRARAEFNPTTRFLGEVAGQVLPAIATLGGSVGARAGVTAAKEGGSVLAKLAGLTPSGAVTRGATGLAERAFGQGLKARVVGAGIEGGASGLGGAVTHSVLSGDPLTAEEALAGAGLGMAIGGGIGVLTHGMAKLGEGAKRLAAEGGADSALIRQLDDLPTKSAASAHAAEGVPHTYFGPEPVPSRGGVVSGELSAKTERELYGSHSLAGRSNKFEVPEVRTEVGPYNPYQAYDDTVEAAVPSHVWGHFKASVDDMSQSATKLENQLGDAHDAAVLQAQRAAKEASEAPALRRKRLVAYGDDVMGQATLVAADNPGVAPAMRQVRRQYRKLMDALGPGFDDAAVAYRTAVDDLARAAGMSPEKALADAAGGAGVVVQAKEAADYVAKVGELAHAVRTARKYLPTEAAVFARSKGTAEKFWAAVESIQSSPLKEAAPFQAQLKETIDNLVTSSGLQVQGTSAMERLMSLREALDGAGRGAADTWDAATWRLREAVPRTSGKPARALTPADAKATAKADAQSAAKPEPVTADEAALPDEDTPTGKKGKTWGDQMVNRARWEAAHRLAGVVTGAKGGSSGKNLVRYGITAAFMGLRGLAKTAIKDAAAKIAAVSAVRGVVRAGGPRGLALYQSATGHLTEEADLREAFANRSKELRELAVAGKDRLFAFAQQLSAAGHPDFAYALYQAASKASDAIVTRLPKDPPGTRWGTEYLWDAPAEQIEVFAQEYAAAITPIAFIQEMAEDPAGVHPSAVQTLRDAWPNVYDDFRAQALVQIGVTGTKNMDRGQLQALSVILDVPLDPTMTPEFIAGQQAMYMPQNQPPPPDAGGTTSGPPGRPPGADATASQRLSNR